MKFSTFVGVYFIPGAGQIALSASEAIVLGEITTDVSTEHIKQLMMG
ncbi:hypothetical protein HMPREF9087_0794 [Enterococcus casseliflavus ATCC 12755]|uniref:Uncharacterized protein n=1 Tax=Enterococcus casseliflavus ATCC 12755 TaxID=888066 RepID=F0EHA2_ENTCA|nr:hypothetical protein HMPREF9087_0794 [Enterococcus casseliflavus ATCC 12755]